MIQPCGLAERIEWERSNPNCCVRCRRGRNPGSFGHCDKCLDYFKLRARKHYGFKGSARSGRPTIQRLAEGSTKS
jgi:hypothetical protein